MQSTYRSSVIPTFRYRDAGRALEWLCDVLGFERQVVYAEPNGRLMHAELTFPGGGMVMLGSQKEDEQSSHLPNAFQAGGAEPFGMYLVVPDADASFARALAAGATVALAVHDTEYGSREFSVKDPEERTWTIGTYDPWKKNG